MSAAPERLTCQDRSSGGLCAPHLPSVQDRLSASTCAGAKKRRPASSLEKNPPSLSPSTATPKKAGKKKKKKNPTTPARGSGCLRLAGVRSRPPPGPAGFRDPPADAGSSPVPGAAKSRTSVTWIFSREGAATPSFRARSVRNRRTHAEHGVPACGPVTNSSLYRSPARFPGRLEGPPEGIFFFFFFWFVEGGCKRKAPEVDVTELRGEREL